MLREFLEKYHNARNLKKAHKLKPGHIVVLMRKKRPKAHEIISKLEEHDGTLVFVLRPVQKSAKFKTIATHRELIF